ncbi:co-chaperone HscB [Candidatus Annandia pinicola]|uniref:co-chaperone HscB n=1 Tax=Candidatus Annandia pinicola TaxID=1345117 RepID=UPI001D022284|nr:co-chaperone HscB [Candidatus Annandia pinicola]UDG80327.1 Co-chaperone protein HscB [Candidatus Annandia pinicola]
MNYFKFFNLKSLFFINKKTLSHNFKKLQKKNHPDLNISSLEKKKIALKKTTFLNRIYNIIYDKFTRINYLLFLNKVNINETIILDKYKDLERKFEIFNYLDYLKKKKKITKDEIMSLKALYNYIFSQKLYFSKKININIKEKRWFNVIIIFNKLIFLKRIEDKANEIDLLKKKII